MYSFLIESSSMTTLPHWNDDDTIFMEKYPNGIPLVDMIPFYDAVSKNESLKLEWVCPGKREPKSEEKTEPSVTTAVTNSKVDTPESQSTAAKLAEFDFDESFSQPLFSGTGVCGTQPLRRVVGSGRHPPRQPRVANMDKILNDLFRSRKETVPISSSDSVQQPTTHLSSGSHGDSGSTTTSEFPNTSLQKDPKPNTNAVPLRAPDSVTDKEHTPKSEMDVDPSQSCSQTEFPVVGHTYIPEHSCATSMNLASSELSTTLPSESCNSELPTQFAHAHITE